MKKNNKIHCAFLFLLLFINCDVTIGQIVTQKGVFVSYQVIYKHSEDNSGEANFIMFLDSVYSNKFAKYAKNMNRKSCQSSSSLLHYFMSGKKYTMTIVIF